MRRSFRADFIITVASQADMMKADDEDIKGLFDHIDMFNLMTYDYTVSDIVDSPITAPNEPLYPPPASTGIWNDSVSVTIDGYISQGIPPAKMSIGIAYYGMYSLSFYYHIQTKLNIKIEKVMHGMYQMQEIIGVHLD